MWIVMYNGISGECSCEPYSEWLVDDLAFMSRINCLYPNDAWFII